VQAGASALVGSRWLREAGGMPPSKFTHSSQQFSDRYLCFAEREEIAFYKARGLGVCAIARKIGGSASTIYRELRRNAATRSGGFEYPQLWLNGMRIVVHVDPKRQNWRKTTHCGNMLKIGFRVRCWTRMGTS
jgi:Transposase and inactivated derivatives, IS30 family